MIKLNPIPDPVTGKYFQVELRYFRLSKDKEMDLQVEISYLDTDQSTLMIEAIEDMQVNDGEKRRLKDQFKTYKLPLKTTRGQYVNVQTGENVYPDPQTGEYDPAINRITELEYWQNIPNQLGGNTKVSEDVYQMIRTSMINIVNRYLGINYSE